jgi:hypothetical protein
MTAEDRNRKMNYGHSIPRSWIPEFNLTHRRQSDSNKSDAPGPAATAAKTLRNARCNLRRQTRMALKRQNTRKVNNNLRVLQKAAAALFTVVGFLTGGSVGLANRSKPNAELIL